MLEELKRDCTLAAKKLPCDYAKVDVTILADGYHDAKEVNDRELMNSYAGALCLRFWAKLGVMYNKCKTLGWDYSDCFSGLWTAITLACEQQAWKTKNINAQTAINQTLDTRVIKAGFYESNLLKNKANYNTMSIHAPLSDGEDDNMALGDVLEADNRDQMVMESDETVRAIVQQFIDRKKVVEAIFLDTIAYTDADKVTKKPIKKADDSGSTISVTEHYHQFWPYKIVQRLSKLPEDYDAYFLKRYNIPVHEFDVAIKSIRTSNNQKLYTKLRATLAKNAPMICKALGVERG